MVSSNNDLLIPKITLRNPGGVQSDNPSDAILTDREDPLASESTNADENPHERYHHRVPHDMTMDANSQSRQVPSMFAPHDGLPGFPAPSGFVIPTEGLAANAHNVELTADGAGFVMEMDSGVASKGETDQTQGNSEEEQYQSQNQGQNYQAAVAGANDDSEEQQQSPKLFSVIVTQPVVQQQNNYRPQQYQPQQGNVAQKYNKSIYPRIEYQQQQHQQEAIQSAVGSSPSINHHVRNNNAGITPQVNQVHNSNPVHPHASSHPTVPGIPLHLMIQPQNPSQIQSQQQNPLAYGGRLSGINSQLSNQAPNPSSSTGTNQASRLPVFIERHQAIPTASSSSSASSPSSASSSSRVRQNYHNVNQAMQSSASSDSVVNPLSPASASSGQQPQQQPVIIPMPSSISSLLSGSNIPLGMPVPGLLMGLAKQEKQLQQQQQQTQQQPQMSLAQHLATQMLKAAISDRNMQLAKRRSKRDIEREHFRGNHLKHQDFDSHPLTDHEPLESGFPGSFGFDDDGLPPSPGIPPPMFDGPPSLHHGYHHNPDFASGSRRRSLSQGSGGGRMRGARRSYVGEGSHPKKSFGILGSGNFEVIRGGIYRDDSDAHAGHGSRLREHRHHPSSDASDYDDGASNGNKRYAHAGGAGYPSSDDYFPGVMGFQGFDNFQLASNQEEEMKKSVDDMESEAGINDSNLQSMSATRHFPVVVDSEQDLMATA